MVAVVAARSAVNHKETIKDAAWARVKNSDAFTVQMHFTFIRDTNVSFELVSFPTAVPLLRVSTLLSVVLCVLSVSMARLIIYCIARSNSEESIDWHFSRDDHDGTIRISLSINRHNQITVESRLTKNTHTHTHEKNRLRLLFSLAPLLCSLLTETLHQYR